MKRILVIFLAVLIAIALTACGESAAPAAGTLGTDAPDAAATATAAVSAESEASPEATPEATPVPAPEPTAEAMDAAQGGETGIVGSWKIKEADLRGTVYSAQELQEIAAELGELGLVFTMQLTFEPGGTGEMAFEGLELGDTDMSLTWQGGGSEFSMTDSEGSTTPIAYNADDDTFSLESGVSLMTFERK